MYAVASAISYRAGWCYEVTGLTKRSGDGISHIGEETNQASVQE